MAVARQWSLTGVESLPYLRLDEHRALHWTDRAVTADLLTYGTGRRDDIERYSLWLAFGFLNHASTWLRTCEIAVDYGRPMK